MEIENFIKIDENNSLSEQLGYYVGEYIISHFLPTLSCDIIYSRNVIKISDEEEKEIKRLDKLWFTFNKTLDKSKEWNDYQEYRFKLIRKYIPKELGCILPDLVKTNDFNIEQFKQGLEMSLFDCDISYYDTNDAEIMFRGDCEKSNEVLSCWNGFIKLKRSKIYEEK